MNEITIVVFILLLVAISSFITTSNVYNSKEKGFRKITKTGYTIVGINLIIIILTFFQYSVNKREFQESEIKALKKQDERDSVLRLRYDSSLYIMKEKYDTSNLKTILVVTDLLAKYGFKLDSTNQRLLKIVRDSSKTKVILPNDPVVQLCPKMGIEFNKIQDNNFVYNINICSKDAGSANFNLICPVVIEDSIGNLTYLGITDLSSDFNIAKDGYITNYVKIPDTFSYKFLYILFTGTYMNIDNTKTFNLNDLYYYNTKGKTIGLFKGDTKTRITSFIMSKTTQNSKYR